MRKLVLVAIVCLLYSCGGEVVLSPKPRSYPRVDYPEKKYEVENFGDCPFQAEIPTYGKVNNVENYRGKDATNDCWFNITFPHFNATMYLSYIPIKSYKEFEEFRDDSYEIVNQINKNSDYMEEIPFRKDSGSGGIVFDFEGPAASPFQFFITDSTSHNLRGALYINSEVRPDSLAPVIDFLESDVKNFIQTFQWKEN